MFNSFLRNFFIFFLLYYSSIIIIKYLLNYYIEFKYFEINYYVVLSFFLIGNLFNLIEKNDPKISIIKKNSFSSNLDNILPILVYLVLLITLPLEVFNMWQDKLSSHNFDGIKKLYFFKSVIILLPIFSLIIIIVKWKKYIR